jgi:hypothetical protein
MFLINNVDMGIMNGDFEAIRGYLEKYIGK